MQVSLGNVRYNARDGMYEARVDIQRDGRTFRYPCAIHGAIDMDPDRVCLGLTRQAMRMSDTGTPLMSRI